MYTYAAMPSIDVTATKIRLRQMRQSHKLTVKEVQEAIGLESIQAVYKHESLRTKNLPSIDSFVALARLYHCHIDDLIVCSYMAA